VFGILEIILIEKPPGEPFLASQMIALSSFWGTLVHTTDEGGCLIFSWLGVYSTGGLGLLEAKA
jgi:hypothetical protein